MFAIVRFLLLLIFVELTTASIFISSDSFTTSWPFDEDRVENSGSACSSAYIKN